MTMPKACALAGMRLRAHISLRRIYGDRRAIEHINKCYT